MMFEEKEFKQTRSRRIRRVKRWLRYVPRRSNIHRYPVFGLFAGVLRKRSYLWSFRVEHAVPAIYAGCILTLLPVFGIQLLLAIVLALALKANLPVLVSLQFISNPFTVLPIWYTLYQIGRYFLSVFAIEAPTLQRGEVRIILDNFVSGEWGTNFERIATVFGVTSLGAVIIGTFFGFVLSIVYRFVANRTAASYALLQQKIQERKTLELSSSSDPDLIKRQKAEGRSEE